MNRCYPPITVVIPCYRCVDTIERALTSVLNQTLPVAEIILVDDFSNDGTLNFLWELQKKYHYKNIKVISLASNCGPGVARNMGWDLAVETWVAFLDSDDAWHHQKIEVQFSWMSKFPNIYLCAHDTSIWNSDQLGLQLTFNGDGKVISPFKLLFKNSIPTRSVIVRRSVSNRFGGGKNAEDYILWLEMGFEGHEMRKLPVILAYSFRPDSSPGGLSGNLLSHEIQELKCFLKLFNSNKIGLILLLIATFFSLIKYIKRVAISCLKQ